MRAAGLALGLVAGGVGLANAALTGAIFTTDATGERVNQNIYAAKEDVYLNGGPQNQNSAGLPDGYYFFQVTDPSGHVLLSTDLAECRQLVVVNGVVSGPGYDPGGLFVPADATCLHAAGAFNPANGSTTVQLIPYDDTPNPGGEYKVWLIAQTAGTSIDGTQIAFSNPDSKTDNFKVREAAPPPDTWMISGMKFYDANVNGMKDPDEPGIPFWKIELFGDATSNTTTDQSGNYLFDHLPAGSYGVCEVIPEDSPKWVPTTPTSITGIVLPPDSTGNDFGNVCLGAGGGKTLGFWSNKNGQALFGADDLALMVALNLRDAAGNHFDPASYSDFRTWLLGASATNMAYMLSAQLAAMALNVHNGLVLANANVFAGDAPAGCTVAGLNDGFISIANLMAAADASLGAHGLTLAGDSERSCQEFMKNALDDANNNKNFVQAEPCDVNYSGNEPSCAPAPEEEGEK